MKNVYLYKQEASKSILKNLSQSRVNFGHFRINYKHKTFCKLYKLILLSFDFQ